MDRRLAKENIGLGFKMVKELNKKQFKSADKNAGKMIKNLKYIQKEIRSGKAKKEKR